MQIPGIHMQQPSVSTEVLCLLNMVTEDELRDDDEYEGRRSKAELLEDELCPL